MIYDTTLVYILAGIRRTRTGCLCYPTALALGRMARACYKESAMGAPRAGDDRESFTIVPIGVVLAHQATPWRDSRCRD